MKLSLAMVIGDLPGDIGDKTTTNDKNGFLAEYTELVHRINDTQERIHGLGLLADHGLVNLELEIMVVEVFLHLLAIHVEDVGIHDGQGPAPALVAVGQLAIPLLEDTIEEGKVIFDLLIALDVKASLRLSDGGVEVRHYGGFNKKMLRWGCVESEKERWERLWRGDVMGRKE